MATKEINEVATAQTETSTKRKNVSNTSQQASFNRVNDNAAMEAAQAKGFRMESDLLGPREVPADALYGVQTLRGIENFKISRYKLDQFPEFIAGLMITKMAAAMANRELGTLSAEKEKAILSACEEILHGKHHEQFPVDMIQGGAGTSTNMNANEVITNRALQIMGHNPGEYGYLSPNDDVNQAQSTNDAYPTAIHVGMYLANIRFERHLRKLIESLRTKADEFRDILKIGRTQLQDAVPMTLGQTFDGFASILNDELRHLTEAADDFLTVNMGATAIGTGLTAQPGYAEKVVKAMRKITGLNFRLADDLVGATSDASCLVGYAAELKRIAVKVNKICNDLRLLSSGPRTGLGEINLPARQPGSSIMPGKVNPVIPEVMNQVCFRVIGNDTTVTMAGDAAQMELNAMEPIMALCDFESVDLMCNGFDTLRTRCIDGITVNKERCEREVKESVSLVTALNPIIGYKRATELAKEATQTGKTVYDLVLEKGILSKKDLEEVLAPKNMIKPVKLNIKPLK